MSEQLDLFNSNKSFSVLSKITAIRPESTRREDKEFLRDPEASLEGSDWAFVVPRCFNDALDIKKTQRIENKFRENSKGKHKIWTQGSIFFFKTGDIFYNKKEAYANWPKAISDELYAIQVVSGKSSTPGRSGKNEKDRDKGEVTFSIYHCCKKEKVLIKQETRTTTQDDFIKILILGLESVSL